MRRGPLRGEPITPLRRSRAAGVTLFELLAAIVILGLGLAAVSGLVTYGVISHQKAQNYTIAAARAAQEIERVRDAHYLGATMTTALFPTGTYTIASGTQATFTVSELRNGSGTITLDLDPAAKATNHGTGQPYSNLKLVTVTLAWDDLHGVRNSYTAATQIANRP